MPSNRSIQSRARSKMGQETDRLLATVAFVTIRADHHRHWLRRSRASNTGRRDFSPQAPVWLTMD